jgi:hypothetical protein
MVGQTITDMPVGGDCPQVVTYEKKKQLSLILFREQNNPIQKPFFIKRFGEGV